VVLEVDAETYPRMKLKLRLRTAQGQQI
jgi:hypothetical protein